MDTWNENDATEYDPYGRDGEPKVYEQKSCSLGLNNTKTTMTYSRAFPNAVWHL